MSDCSDQNRRQYERRPGRDSQVTLAVPGADHRQAMLIEISRGGAACACSWTAEPGQHTEVYFQGFAKPVQARVARSINGTIALAFLQSDEDLALVDRVLDQFSDLV